MIKVNDRYNLVSEMFEACSDFIKIDPDIEDADVDILLISSIETKIYSERLTVLIDPEPNIIFGNNFYQALKSCKPNSLVFNSGYNIKTKQSNLYLINSVLTARHNSEIQQIDFTEPKPFLSNALMGNWSMPRGTILLGLIQKNILEKCIVNYYQSPIAQVKEKETRQYFFNYRSDILDTIDNPVFVTTAFTDNQLNTCRPIPGTQFGNPSWVSQIIAKDIYQQSYMSIVAETDAGPDIFFMSEKITKPLLVGHPFVVYGCCGYLAELKKLGFKTFSLWFDESYDLIENDIDRVNSIVDSVYNFSLLPIDKKQQYLSEMKPVLDHNRKLITNKMWLLSTLSEWIKTNIK